MRYAVAALALLSISAQAADFTIFNNDRSWGCSPLPEVACSGINPAHEAGDSEVALLLDKSHGLTGEISLAARMQALIKAKHSIRIQALIFSGDESGLRVAEVLKKKKLDNPNIDIRVIVDAMSNPSWQTQWMYYDLKQNGIEVEGYEALYLQLINETSTKDPLLVNKRFHDKMWVIDGDDADGIAVVGGLNVANEYFRVDLTPKNHWRDQDVIVRGAIVKDIAATFDRNYDYFKGIKAAKPDLFNTDKAWQNWRWVVRHTWKTPVWFHKDAKIAAEVEKAFSRVLNLDWQPARMRFVQSRPRFGETYILQTYLDLIHGASHPGGEILIANAYFIPEPEIRDALAAAAAAGADVKILTNSYETNDLQQLSLASRYLYKPILDNGGKHTQIWEYVGAPFGEGTIHAKFAVFDRKVALVGSYNLDARSQKLNSETALVFENEHLASELAGQYLTYDLGKSVLIRPEQAAAWHNTSGAKGVQVQLSLKMVPML